MAQHLAYNSLFLGQLHFRRVKITGKLHKGLALDFKPGWHSRTHHVSDGTQIVIRDPFPEFKLRMYHHRSVIKQIGNRLNLISDRGHRRQRHDYSRVVFAQTERNDHPASHLDRVLHFFRDGIGEQSVKRQRNYYLSK